MEVPEGLTVRSTTMQTQLVLQGAPKCFLATLQASRVEQIVLQSWQTGSLPSGKGTKISLAKEGGMMRRVLMNLLSGMVGRRVDGVMVMVGVVVEEEGGE